jgi:hypothetical protein
MRECRCFGTNDLMSRGPVAHGIRPPSSAMRNCPSGRRTNDVILPLLCCTPKISDIPLLIDPAMSWQRCVPKFSLSVVSNSAFKLVELSVGGSTLKVNFSPSVCAMS